MELATRKGHKRFVKYLLVSSHSIIRTVSATDVMLFGYSGLARTIRDYAGLSPEDLKVWTDTKVGRQIYVSECPK